jgi:hypothetical protein
MIFMRVRMIFMRVRMIFMRVRMIFMRALPQTHLKRSDFKSEAAGTL